MIPTPTVMRMTAKAKKNEARRMVGIEDTFRVTGAKRPAPRVIYPAFHRPTGWRVTLHHPMLTSTRASEAKRSAGEMT